MLIAGSPLDFSCIVASRPLFFYPQGILFFAFSRNTVPGKLPAGPFSGLFGTGIVPGRAPGKRSRSTKNRPWGSPVSMDRQAPSGRLFYFQAETGQIRQIS